MAYVVYLWGPETASHPVVFGELNSICTTLFEEWGGEFVTI